MSISIEVDIEISDIVSQTNRYEKCSLLRKLLSKISKEDLIEVIGQVADDNHKILMNRYFGKLSATNASVNEREFQENVLKISKNYISLTKEEENLIANIAKRF
jgi:hypothetical protein